MMPAQQMQNTGGQQMMMMMPGQMQGQMQNLKKHYSKRVQFAIQDVLDIRSAGWKKKTFKPAAKRKDEIRREQEMELRRVASGQEVGASEVQIAGARRPAMGW